MSQNQKYTVIHFIFWTAKQKLHEHIGCRLNFAKYEYGIQKKYK